MVVLGNGIHYYLSTAPMATSSPKRGHDINDLFLERSSDLGGPIFRDPSLKPSIYSRAPSQKAKRPSTGVPHGRVLGPLFRDLGYYQDSVIYQSALA